MKSPSLVINGKLVKPHRYWCKRHYRPLLVGMACAAVYGWGLRWAEMELGITVPNWIVAVAAQAMMLVGAWCARLMWFD